MSNAFEYGDALLPRPEGAEGEDSPTPQIESNQPYLSLATFRMVLLADEVLESFFETDLSASFRLEPVPLMELPPANNGFLGGLWSNIATDDTSRLTVAAETNSVATSSTLVTTEAEKSALSPTSPAGIDPLAQATNVVANAFMERTPFAIDDAGDDDEDEDDEEEAEQDDVLDEVRFRFCRVALCPFFFLRS